MYINGNNLKVKRYSSGELKLVKSVLDSYIVNNKVEILYLGEYSVFELILIINYYVHKKIVVDLILGYLPYQRMDNKDRDELDTVNYVVDVFNKLNLNSITICEPHCDINLFDNCKEFSYIKNMKDKVFKDINFDSEKDIVVLADKGGVKRYGDVAKNIIYFNKVRDLETGLIVKHEIVGNIDKSRKIIIIDDIVSTGDTIVNIIDELTRLGCKDIYVLAGHIENNKYNRRIFSYSNVRQVISTNSLRKKGMKKLKLYDVRKIIENKMR